MRAPEFLVIDSERLSPAGLQAALNDAGKDGWILQTTVGARVVLIRWPEGPIDPSTPLAKGGNP